jgi:hypothetical protein
VEMKRNLNLGDAAASRVASLRELVGARWTCEEGRVVEVVCSDQSTGSRLKRCSSTLWREGEREVPRRDSLDEPEGPLLGRVEGYRK